MPDLRFADGVVDLLFETKAHEQPLGVSQIEGLCLSRPSNRSKDVAYRLSERALLTVNSVQIFPNGFPADFSIMLVVKTDPGKLSAFSTRPGP